jgi:hypothetical protein
MGSDGLPSPLPMVMVVTKESPKVGVASIGASPQGLPHPWELARWLDSQGKLIESLYELSATN